MTGLILLQNNEIVKIQSLLRASKARDDYKTLGKWEYPETKYGSLLSQSRTGYCQLSHFRDCSKARGAHGVQRVWVTVSHRLCTIYKGTWDDLFPVISGRGKWSTCLFPIYMISKFSYRNMFYSYSEEGKSQASK